MDHPRRNACKAVGGRKTGVAAVTKPVDATALGPKPEVAETVFKNAGKRIVRKPVLKAETTKRPIMSHVRGIGRRHP